MKRKQATVTGAAIAMVAALAGGSIAFLRDTDSETNKFTVGDVSIDLNEKQRNDDNTALEDFEQDKKLLPLVGSAQGEKDEFGMPKNAKNYADKICNVTNTDNSDAYVRFYFAIPSALDDGYDTFNAGANVLHFNFGNAKNATTGEFETTAGKTWNWNHGANNSKWNYFETTIDGVAYNVYYADYMEKLAPGATTTNAVQGVYLDSKVDFKENTNGSHSMVLINANGTETPVNLDFDPMADGIKCPVYAIAAQADGFDSASAAFDAAFGQNYNPWGGTATNWQ